MTNRIAFFLFVILAAGLAADLTLNEGTASFFLVRKFLTLLDWAIFWR